MALADCHVSTLGALVQKQVKSIQQSGMFG